jgi:ergothioneine biosynthesis protein EgtB
MAGNAHDGPRVDDARTGDRRALAHALQASRADTLATLAAYRRARPDLQVPYRESLNPPIWEIGHIGWFQEFWIDRNPQRALGLAADPDAARPDSVRAGGDALYNSSRVAHANRWALPLPTIDATLVDLDAQLARTLALLETATDDDPGCYFHRLALFHEDMHHEAALYMAQHLGIPIDDPRWQPASLAGARDELAFDAGTWRLGHAGPGFAFDNELGAHSLALPATRIDARVVSWAEYLPFVEGGGYVDPAGWSDAGLAWLASTGLEAPRYLRHTGKRWEAWRHGQWTALDLSHAACHLSLHEAQAWCHWAKRRLPTEAEWERAAVAGGERFAWGQVWEWTASAFEPYPGFVAHPYRDYSAPWFGTRQVLRGASFMTQPRMRDARYRNYFPAHRNDVPAGFRSCALLDTGDLRAH